MWGAWGEHIWLAPNRYALHFSTAQLERNETIRSGLNTAYQEAINGFETENEFRVSVGASAKPLALPVCGIARWRLPICKPKGIRDAGACRSASVL